MTGGGHVWLHEEDNHFYDFISGAWKACVHPSVKLYSSRTESGTILSRVGVAPPPLRIRAWTDSKIQGCTHKSWALPRTLRGVNLRRFLIDLDWGPRVTLHICRSCPLKGRPTAGRRPRTHITQIFTLSVL